MGQNQSNVVTNYLPENKVEDNSTTTTEILPLAAVGAGIIILIVMCGAFYCFNKRSRKPPAGIACQPTMGVSCPRAPPIAIAGQQPTMGYAPPHHNYPPNIGHSVLNERQFHPNMNMGSQMGAGKSFNNQQF